MGERKAPQSQSRRGMQPPAQHQYGVEPIFILALPRSLSVEPRLHAHGKTVRHHSAGNTGTSCRQSSNMRTQTQHLQKDDKIRQHRKCVDCDRQGEPLFLHGFSTRKSFFVESSTVNDRVHAGPGYFQRLGPPPTAGLAFRIGIMKTQNVQTRTCAEQIDVKCPLLQQQAGKCTAIHVDTQNSGANAAKPSTKQRRRCVNLAREPWELLAQGGGRASPVLCAGETTHDGPLETGEAE